jgi:hypothetical protein
MPVAGAGRAMQEWSANPAQVTENHYEIKHDNQN